MADKLSVEVKKFGEEFEGGERREIEARDYLWQELPPKIAALENELGLAIPFVEMAAYADNSGEEYGRLCQECESVFSQHTDNCALSAWLERNKEEA